jgi:multiple sugar transport system substrate-binding protein
MISSRSPSSSAGPAGRESGLFGTFYELLVSAGGDLFGPDLEPVLDAPPGIWAADRLTELHHRRRVTPRELPNWHYDEISASFRAGDAAMVCDWPGSDYLYHDPATCRVAGRVGLALLPAGFTGRRAAYAGVHSFAIPKTAANREGAGRLLRYLTSAEAQLLEARRGALPVRQSAFARIREEVSKDERQAHRLGLLARTAEEALIIPPKFAAYPDCEDAIWHALQKAMNGAVTPIDAVKEAAAVIRVVVAAARGASEVH